jgi:hypothetical protein
MKAYWENGGIALRIPDFGSRWRWVVSFTPRPLYPQGKRPWYPLDMRLGGPQSLSGHGGKEKNSQTLPRLEPPVIQPVAQRYTTELSRLPSGKYILCISQAMYRTFLLENLKRPIRRPRFRWEDNIRMHLKETDWEGVEEVHLTPDRDQWWALVNMVMKLWVP